MAEERKTTQTEGPHHLVLENRHKLSISGVSDVDSFDEHMISLYTTQGMLQITGRDLHIRKLSVDSAELCVEGEIWGMEYTDNQTGRPGGFLSRLLR